MAPFFELNVTSTSTLALVSPGPFEAKKTSYVFPGCTSKVCCQVCETEFGPRSATRL